ncbi:MAG: aminopeptidase P family N-terminal domain-containing protein, partial [Rhodobacteraceae bacterium]|nr:aminopeptidase P family N-terminal domain-containing protein [Paracoccaceae bacterium]
TPVDWPEVKPADWLREMLPAGGKVGFDPWLHTAREIEDLRAGLEGTAIEICETTNFVDSIWPDQPAPPLGPVRVHPLEVAGESAADKRARLGAELTRAGHAAAVLTLPDSIAWLLNIRGTDIPRNPVVHAFAILEAGGHVTLFIAGGKLSDDVRAHLGPDITLRPPEALEPALRTLTGPVRVDRATAPLAVSRILKDAGVAVAWGQDPCILPKARK